ncbi:hypothetical protein J7T55_004215 [Diaporthe amygdali]|uniref:uncharacterized protein n=1 Tax=Phomopsis amygdali TaxID=1214568 RepID=UPI0022FDDD6C|nr:uncharacterized protein J7T55_004215 [Diaporthe amygdali]KAJ0103812.1 hypothetical protein J7T55_004215 [Diaporthe amygdali]
MSVIYIVHLFSWSDGSVALGGSLGASLTWSDRSVGSFGSSGAKRRSSCLSHPFAPSRDLLLSRSESFQACPAGLWGLSAPSGDQQCSPGSIPVTFVTPGYRGFVLGLVGVHPSLMTEKPPQWFTSVPH